jgi:menaquinol-cytochrome c reductase cytochrome b/c subunit
MVEVPEHLLKRAQAAKRKAQAKAASGEGATQSGPDAGANAASEASTSKASSAGRIPAHLLERSKAARERAAGSSGEESVPVTAAAAVATATTPSSATPIGTGPAGHTQRLLAVVKAGSIQDVKAKPQDKVHVWPHLLAVEFVSALLLLAFLFVFSVFVNAPLLELANPNQTPNPSKAPWYFLGLQELLTMFHPMIAGVTIPGMGIFLLILAPYIDRNPSNKPEDRKVAVTLFTVHLMYWAVLVMIGSFFRGTGFNFAWPWIDGLFFEL